MSNVYYYKVRGMDNEENYSFWSSTVSAAPEAVTPESPGNFAGVAQSTYSILWSWDDLSNETAYRIKYSTDTGTTLVELGEDDTDWLEKGLTVNTSYYRVVLGTNSVGEGALSSAATTWTLARDPQSANFTAVNKTSVTITWSINGNPGYTRYALARSTGSDFDVNVDTFVMLSDNLTANSTTAYNLLSNTTYYFRVWAYNGDGIMTGFAGPVSTTTLIAPGDTPYDVVINEIAWAGTESEPLLGEWIELRNNTGKDIDISNWSIYGADTGVTLNFADADGNTTTIIPANGYLVYADNNTVFSLGATVHIWDSDMGLNTGGDHIILYNGPNRTGSIVDEVDDNTGAWFVALSGGQSMERVNSTSSGTTTTNWVINDGIALTGDTDEGTIKLKWTAPGDDGTGGGDASSYLVKYASRYIDTGDFDAPWVSTYTQTWSPVTYGEEDGGVGNRVVSGLNYGVTYWFVMKAADEQGMIRILRSRQT